jgi:ADP-ribosyl-[dinitrogen reductase] hydrolase
VIGDALGVPVEFKSRSERKRHPVTGMQGYGTFDLPPGSWSDDSSLMLCTTESLLDGFDGNRMGLLFIRWLKDAYWTPWGHTFDVGSGTHQAIMRMAQGIPPEQSGGISEGDNGNGSLMRILPTGLYFSAPPVEEILGYASRASSLTHRHPRSRMACGFYCLMVSHLLKGMEPARAYGKAIKDISPHWDEEPYSKELSHFTRILSGSIGDLPENEIHSSGYVMHTLEAGIWCLLNTRSYEESVLKAVNLGEDTDTTGIVTGGLAGITYGLKAMPEEWMDTIVRKDDITSLFERFCHLLVI